MKKEIVPSPESNSKKAIVYFTNELSAKALIRIFSKLNVNLGSKTAIKLHTGERNGPNIIPREWVKELIDNKLPDATIIETNTYYEGDRYTTKDHLETLKINGWTFSPVDIIDADGATTLPVNGGKHFKEMSMGKNILNYNSLLALTHFKGHTVGGFGGSNKNIGIGCADGKIGKALIHTSESSSAMWSATKEEFMERMTESTKAVLDYFRGNIAYINVLRNMSVSCDCEGCAAAPVVTPNIGIIASLDILAIDKASVDLVYALNPHENQELVERMETRHGLRQLSYMKELGMGSDEYILLDINNNDKEITPADAVANVVPFSL